LEEQTRLPVSACLTLPGFRVLQTNIPGSGLLRSQDRFSGHLGQPFIHQTRAVEARADAGKIDKIDSADRDQSGANTAQQMFLGPVPEDHLGDTVIVQQLAQQQALRAGADDRNLRLHRPIFGPNEACRNEIQSPSHRR
jgi:hypothetical protein